MQTNFFSIMVAFLLAGLVIAGFYTFGDILTTQNQAPQGVYYDEGIRDRVQSISGNTSSYLDTANNAEDALGNSSITQGAGTGQNQFFNSLPGIWKTLKNSPIVIYQLSIGFIQERIVSNIEAFDVIAGILILAILVAVVYWVTTGQGGKN